MSCRKNHHGYTMIELMIVVAIVTLLSSIATRVVPFVQQKTRDNTRRYALSSLKHVIELYHADNGYYPRLEVGVNTYMTFFTASDGFSATVAPKQITPTGYVPDIVPTYYDALPVDPQPGPSTLSGCSALGYERNWAYFSNGMHYKLVMNCAPEVGFVSPDDPLVDPASCLLGDCYAWAISDEMDYTTFTLGWQ